MYVVTVVPITKGPALGELTFFSRTRPAPGSVVEVPIRKRAVPGMVVSATDVREHKQDIKQAGYELKKIAGKSREVLSPAFVSAIERTARYHQASLGTTLSEFTFKETLTGSVRPRSAVAEPSAMRPDVLVLQADRAERLSTYRNLVRETFARGKSLLIIAPSLVEVETLKGGLARGIEAQIITLSSALTGAQLRAAWSKVAKGTEPILVVGTPPALSAPRAFDTIVIEREGARAYKGRARPHFDSRITGEFVAAATGARLILADYPVRVETRYRVENHTADDMVRPQLRSASHAAITIIDTRAVDTMSKERRSFQPLSAHALESVASAIGAGERALVYATRKGIAPLTVCNDCGTPIVDPVTGTPMTLHKTARGNEFISRRTGAILPAETLCGKCGGWNLVTLGIGVDRVYDYLTKCFPKTDITLFTADTAPTHKAGMRLVSHFYAAPGSIIVGTERMLPYLVEPVSVCAISSIDSVLSNASWRANEHALSLLMSLQSTADTELIVETRSPEHELLKTLRSGNPMDFYRTEIKDREEYGYPPFATFIRIAWAGTETQIARTRSLVLSALSGLDVVGPLPPELVARNQWREQCVVRIADGWPQGTQLQPLPPNVEVTIDPDEIV